MKRLLIATIILASLGCGNFRRAAVPVADKTTSLLEEISILADKSFTGADRQNFAKVVMVPALRATRELVTCLETGDCKQISVHLTIISQSLLAGINAFASKLPNGPEKDKFIGKLQAAMDFVTDLYRRAGGKVEEMAYPYPVQMVIQ